MIFESTTRQPKFSEEGRVGHFIFFICELASGQGTIFRILTLAQISIFYNRGSMAGSITDSVT